MGEKQTIQYVCQSCGAEFPRWQGRCTGCNSWNTLEEERIEKRKIANPAIISSDAVLRKKKKTPISIQSVTHSEEEIIPTDIPEFDHVLGKGLVKGSVVLLGGEPGIGKSTLALQAAQNLGQKGQRILYISGEESESQILIRATRVGENSEHVYVYSEVDMGRILHTIEQFLPDVIILDSIQVVYHPDIPSVAGSINQVRSCANALIALVKQMNTIAIIVGHITKDGNLAGPKALEHLVDVILYFEGERNQLYRLLRCFKNRYAGTNEIGVFEMTEKGLKNIDNPSLLFFDATTLRNPGSVIAAVSEGSRVLLVEAQALVVDSGYGMAKRTFLGVDPNRANLMVAAIEKILGIRLSGKDIIVNVIGGLKISEPAMDLSIVMAILSSLFEVPLGEKVGIFGEVGLTGEIRTVPYMQKRIAECEKLGFSKCLVPNLGKVIQRFTKIKPVEMITIRDAFQYLQSLSKTG